jgi:hypothetical protein
VPVAYERRVEEKLGRQFGCFGSSDRKEIVNSTAKSLLAVNILRIPDPALDTSKDSKARQTWINSASNNKVVKSDGGGIKVSCNAQSSELENGLDFSNGFMPQSKIEEVLSGSVYIQLWHGCMIMYCTMVTW